VGIIKRMGYNLVMGILYSISDNKLSLGLYPKLGSSQNPRELYIPLGNIKAYKRINLPKRFHKEI